MKNVMKAKLKTGAPVIGFQIMGNWVEIVEIVGLLGSDFVFLDGEHGALTGIEYIGAEAGRLRKMAGRDEIHGHVVWHHLNIGVARHRLAHGAVDFSPGDILGMQDAAA